MRTSIFGVLLLALVLALSGGLAEEVVMSEDIYSFEVLVNGELLQLPTPMATLTAMGWTDKSLTTETLHPDQYTLETLQHGDQALSVTVFNAGWDTALYADCLLGVVSLDEYTARKGATLVLPKGITLGSTEEDVLEAYGPPSDLYEGSSRNTLTYESGSYARVRITIDREAGNVVDSIEVRNMVAERPEIVVPEGGFPVPAAVAAYQAPAALGESWNDFIVEFAGTLYKLPVPVSALLENGWTPVSKDVWVVAAHDSRTGFELRKDNQVMRATVHNYDDKANTVDHCFVRTILSYEYGPDLPITLSGGITRSSTLEEIVAAYGEPDSTSESSSFLYYTYGKYGERLEISWHVEEEALTKLELQYEPKTLGE